MREELEQLRDNLLESLTDVDKSSLLSIMDGIGEIIDAAEQHHDDAIAGIRAAHEEQRPVTVQTLRDVLGEQLSAALAPFVQVTDVVVKHERRKPTSKRNAKKRTVTRKTARKLKAKR